MPDPIRIALYSDVHCPYAYLAAYRLRKLQHEYQGSITIEYKSLALEYVNKQSTPKPILEDQLRSVVVSPVQGERHYGQSTAR